MIVWICMNLCILTVTLTQHTVFVPIEARHASTGISPSETVLISRENNYCDRNTTYPLYITSFHCYTY